MNNVSLMVDQRGFGEVLRKTFQNSATEIISEILQNSQRAGATEIRFDTSAETGSVVVIDNGSGILPLEAADADLASVGLDLELQAWAKLLRAMDSHYRDPQVAPNQTPLGVGILSIIAASDVAKVVFRSNGKRAEIDTAAFWGNNDYWETWLKRLEDDPDSAGASGFIIEISATERFVRSFEERLGDDEKSVAIGYQGILAVFLNDAATNTALPAKYSHPDKVLFKTVYTDEEGLQHPLTVYRPVRDSFYHPTPNKIGNTVFWYGQKIGAEDLKELFGKFKFMLEVRHGKPVTPVAPTRRCLITDHKVTRIKEFIENEVFEFVKNPDNREKIDYVLFDTIFKANREKARREIDLVAVAPAFEALPEHCGSIGEFASLRYVPSSGPAGMKFMTYAEIAAQNVEIVKDDVFYLDTNTDDASEEPLCWQSADYGVASFLPTFGREFYHLVIGDAERLPVKQIWWKPGLTPHPEAEMFREKGTAALTIRKHRDDESELAEPPADDSFVPVVNTAFVFHSSDTYEFGENSEAVIGVADLETKTVVKWLETYAWALFDYDEEEDGDNQYRESVLADTVSSDYSISDLISRANREVGNVLPKGKFSPPRSIDFVGGNKMQIHLADGKLCELRIYDPTV
jgi:hypothetical protein